MAASPYLSTLNSCLSSSPHSHPDFSVLSHLRGAVLSRPVQKHGSTICRNHCRPSASSSPNSREFAQALLGLNGLEACRKLPQLVKLNQAFSKLWQARILPDRAVELLSISAFGGFTLEGYQSVLEALGVLAAIVTVHECGHFLAAYLQRIHVSRFAIGFGPTLLKYRGKKVEYSVRAIPLGGYVAFPDDDPESDYAPDDPDLLKNRPILDRFLVVSAGVAANVVFAYLILFGQVLTVGLLEREMYPGIVVHDLAPSGAAARAGVENGDVIFAVGDRHFAASESSVYDFVDIVKGNPEQKLSFSVSRSGKPIDVQVVPEKGLDGVGKIGVQLTPNSKSLKVKEKNVIIAAGKAAKEFGRLFRTVTDGLRQVIFNFSQSADKLSGPVAIVAVGAEVARSDVSGLLQFAAIVNINLAVVNTLPLPALDGGYLALIVLEALRGGKKLPDKIEQGIMSSGVLLLLALGTFLMVRDALNLGFIQAL